MAYGNLNDDDGDNGTNDGRFVRPPFLAAISASGVRLDPNVVDWSLLAPVDSLKFYHASVHRGLFVLPAELQRRLRAPPPSASSISMENRGVAASGLRLEARGCNAKLLSTISSALALLDDLAVALQLGQPLRRPIKAGTLGVTATLVTASSHIGLQTWQSQGKVVVDAAVVGISGS